MSELLVLGFHRSGTSLATQLLSQAGLFVGDELIGVMETNPYGHYEDRAVVRIHDGIFRDMGLSWHVTGPFLPLISGERWRQMSDFVDRRKSEHALWGFKDPRACLFAGAWKYLMPDAKAVIVYRDCLASAESLKRRHARDLVEERGPVHLHRLFWQEPDHAERMWVEHNSALLAFIRANEDDTLVIGFDDLAAGFPLVAAVQARWGLDLRPIATGEVFDPAVTSRRATSTGSRLFDDDIAEQIADIWTKLERRAADTVARYGELAHAG